MSIDTVIRESDATPPPISGPSITERQPLDQRKLPVWAVLGIAFLVVVPVLILSSLLAGTLLLRSSGGVVSQPFTSEQPVGVTLGLEEETSGCIELPTGGRDATVCANKTQQLVGLKLTGFQSGSDLTIGQEVDGAVFQIAKDGTLHAELGQAVWSAPVQISGTLVDGQPANVILAVAN